MKLKKIILYLIFFFFAFQISYSQEEESFYYKVNKSFEIFGYIFREIANNYVVAIDPEELVRFGINGILSSLDPYTEYYNEQETEDIDIITSGSYTGVGITVSNRDSMLTIIDIQDEYSAKKNGLRIGDRIVKVDTAFLLYERSDALRKYTRGKVGTPITFYILRDGLNDTLKFVLTRNDIMMKNVSFSDVISDTIGYIKVERFTRSLKDEVKQEYLELKNKHNITSLIIDLRDNPGGMLESAVNICELFIPKGNVIVTTKGRNKEDIKEYYSEEEPIDTNVRIAVLINNSSASASEIVAGAIQDLDRGIIIGQRSYGKGLVQTIVDLPYNGNLKMTTSKYYTPSGRCIQKIDYYLKYSKLKTSADTIFYTKNKRIVFESKGILPDTIVENEVYPDFVNSLINNGHIFKFANRYTSKLNELPQNFKADKKLLQQFKDYLNLQKFNYKTKLLEQFEELLTIAKNEKLSQSTLESLETAKQQIANEEKNLFDINSELILNLIEKEIKLRFISNKEAIKLNLDSDKDITTAKELLAPNKYSKILAGK